MNSPGPLDSHPLAQVARWLVPNSTLLRASALKGGISAEVTVLEIERPDGQTQKLLVRLHGEVDRAHNPQIAADEYKLLSLLHSAGLAVQTPYALDQSGEIFATPYLVLEYVEGETEFAPANMPDFLLQFAAQLARIHQIDGAAPDMSFLPKIDDRYARKLRERPAQVDTSTDEGRVWAALEGVRPFPQRNPSVLLHGDFWPGNLLWRDGQLVAVIDWEDAAIGDPLADVGSSRLELLWAFGIDAMQHFTEHYRALTTLDWTNLPYWDLYAALRLAPFAEWAVDANEEQQMRAGHRWFIAQACEQLS